jgi:antitoxin (DNA-binding transcriptional repressor) of toxin-antitoxin stability system
MEVTMTMRGLRDTRRLKALLRAGKSIKLQDRNQVVARIVPPQQSATATKLPDFEARHQKLFGDRVFDADDFLQYRHGRY